MSTPAPNAPTPREIYERSAAEGERRLSSSALETISTGFTAGFAIVFGIVALGITHGLVSEIGGQAAGKLGGAIAFGLGMVFTVVARAELFTENFLDPVAAVLERRGEASWWRVSRVWAVILALNLAGGAAMSVLLTVEGALTPTAPGALLTVAAEIVARPLLPAFTNALAAGALLTLMTYMLQGTDSVAGRMVIAYLVGVFLAVGPFNHVVVTTLHLVIGMRFGADISITTLAATAVVSAVGNVIGGLAFVTLTQSARALASR